jgi:hypothetical protein
MTGKLEQCRQRSASEIVIIGQRLGNWVFQLSGFCVLRLTATQGPQPSTAVGDLANTVILGFGPRRVS